MASPKGGAAPVDEGSVTNWKNNEVCGQFWDSKSALWENTEKLSDFLGRAKEFAAIFYVGGHGRKFTKSSPRDPFGALLSHFKTSLTRYL